MSVLASVKVRVETLDSFNKEDALGAEGSLPTTTQAPINQKDRSTLNLPAATAQQQVPFPTGMATAQVVVVRASTTTDLQVQTSIAGGASVYNIPVGCAMVFYGVSALYLSSALGGLVDVMVAG